MATKEKETPTGEKEQQGRGGGDRGSTAARPTLTRDWGGPQVRDPAPIVSVNPEADPPQPRAPVRPNRAEQDGETAEEKSQEHKKYVRNPLVSRRSEAPHPHGGSTGHTGYESVENVARSQDGATETPHPHGGGTGHTGYESAENVENVSRVSRVSRIETQDGT